MLHDKPDLNLSIGGQKIERETSMKYLGVLLDDLSFEEHVQYVVTKCTMKLGILGTSREFLDRKSFILLYKSLVLPHIDYCDLVYMTANKYTLHKLQIIQNVACRIILRADNRRGIQEIHHKLNLLTLKERQYLHLSMEGFLHIHTNSSLNNMFASNTIPNE